MKILLPLVTTRRWKDLIVFEQTTVDILMTNLFNLHISRRLSYLEWPLTRLLLLLWPVLWHFDGKGSLSGLNVLSRRSSMVQHIILPSVVNKTNCVCSIVRQFIYHSIQLWSYINLLKYIFLVETKESILLDVRGTYKFSRV